MKSKRMKTAEKLALIKANKQTNPAEALKMATQVLAESAKNAAEALKNFSTAANTMKEDINNGTS